MSKRFLLLTISLFIASMLFTFSAQAEIKAGARVGAYFDANSAFVGGEVLAGFADQWFFNPNVEYVFRDRASQWTVNFDVHYDLPVDSNFYFWIGGGPAIIILDPDSPRRDNQTDLGVNLFGGVGFPIHGTALIPYVQPKVILSDNSEFSLAFGLRF